MENPWKLTTYFFTEADPKKKKPSPTGIHGYYFFGCEAFSPVQKEQGKDTIAPKATPNASEVIAKTPEEKVSEILLKNPGISGASLINTLKIYGLEIVDITAKEADSTSTGLAQLRDQKKESQALTIKPRFRFQEDVKGRPGIGPTRFKVALIQEGLGNLRDLFYYSREAIENAIASFEGKKCFADHPSRSEDQDRPERSVRDIIGHFENVHVEENESGGAMLVAELHTPPEPAFEWARSLIRQAVKYSEKYPEQNLVGLSINASGDAEPVEIDDMLSRDLPDYAKAKILKAREQGASQIRVVSRITDTISTDLVTEPGARGRVLELLEGEKNV